MNAHTDTYTHARAEGEDGDVVRGCLKSSQTKWSAPWEKSVKYVALMLINFLFAVSCNEKSDLQLL